MPSVSSTFATFGTAARSGSIGGTEDWGTESNAQNDDGSRAIYSTSLPNPLEDGFTFYLTATGLTDEIPAGATVDGIIVTIQRRNGGSGTGDWSDSRVSIIKSGTIGSTDKAVVTAYTTSDVEVDYGTNEDDLWNETWTAVQINASDFGVAISCAAVNMEGFDDFMPEIDYIAVEVFYTVVEDVTITSTSLSRSKYRMTFRQRLKRI